jgi:Reverse transcriptase (RNA-dependent DNA polymerase)
LPTRRTSLDIELAIARVRKDAENDLWPDPAGLLDLPRSKTEVAAFRRRFQALRRTPPARAIEGLVPKRDGLTRTAHILPPVVRVYYQALVDSFMHRVDRRLEPAGHIFGYRPRGARRGAKAFGKVLEQWLEFDAAVKSAARDPDVGAVVVADLAAYFERISHERLSAHLLSLGVPTETVKEIRALLRALMGSDFGLPQGCDASSVLGTIFLDPMDKVMRRRGYAFYRYADDIRVLVHSEHEARTALHLLEAQARALGLHLQPGKTRILVGRQEIRREIVEPDAEISAVDYVYRASRRAGMKRVRAKWRSVSRRKPWSPRFVKFLLNRLRSNRDPFAVNWCLARLGVLDWLADSVGPYLALFIDRKRVQSSLLRHLRSPANISSYEEAGLLRALLTAKSVSRALLDYCSEVLSNRNKKPASRQWAALVLGKQGDASDLAVVIDNCRDDVDLARASVVALQETIPSVRNVAYADIETVFSELRPLVGRFKGLARPLWPRYPVW